jgi:ribosomal-protein-alanine N-acetyltransferase
MLNILSSHPIPSHIEGDLVILKRPSTNDQEQWCHLRSISKHMLVPWEPAWNQYSASPRGFKRRFQLIKDGWRDGSAFNYFIFLKSHPQLVGAITLHNIRYGACMSSHIGYWIGLPFMRQGLMTEAVYLILDHAFYSLSLNRIVAACMPTNRPSINLLQKCGFSPEGIAKEYLCINNSWEDHIIFSLISRNYAIR